MKASFYLVLFLSFIACCSSLNAEYQNNQTDSKERLAFDPESVASPLMQMSKEIPIEISYANKEKYLLNPEINELEAKRNQEALHSKAIPWLSICATLLTLSLIALIKAMPKPSLATTIEKEKRSPKEVALARLQALELTLNKEETAQYILMMDHIVKAYIEESKGISAQTLTTEEILAKSALLKTYPIETKEILTTFLKATDSVKYAKYPLSEKEKGDAARLADKIIRS